MRIAQLLNPGWVDLTPTAPFPAYDALALEYERVNKP